MARKLRIQYPGAIYHVLNRGDRREEIFCEDEDRQCFLTTLGEACVRTSWQVHALCLMSNHFHLVIETPHPNLAAGMKWFLGTYTARFNRRHKLCGHLFSGRYKALVVDGSGSGYLRTVCDYVHLIPVRARLLKPEQALREFPWSSWPEYVKPASQRWPWLCVERLLGEYHIPKDSVAGRRRLEEALEARRGIDSVAEFKPIRRGWFLGEAKLKEELFAQVSAKTGKYHYGEAVQESAAANAEGIVREELVHRGWTEQTLTQRRKGDAGKVAIAQRLRQETVVTPEWIAKRLEMGVRTHLAHLPYWHGRRRKKTR